MKSNWTELTINDVCSVTDCQHKTAPTLDIDTEYRMLRTANIRNGQLRDVDETKSVTKEIYDQWSVRGYLIPGDVILTREAPMGEVALLRENEKYKYFLGQRMLQLKASPKVITPEFLYYSLQTKELQHQIMMNEGTGSVVSNIRIPLLKKMKLFVPTLSEQKKITKLLIDIDNKILLNKKIIVNLEQLSQTFFKHWFIDFEFPNEEGQPYKSSGGEMVESELGEIPKDFTLRLLNDICEVKDGTHDSPKQVETGYPLVTSKHLKANEIDFSTTKLISEDDFVKVNKRSLVEYKDILISMIGTVGRLYFVQEHHVNYAIKNIGLIKSSQTEIAEFIYMYFKSPFMINYIKERMTGSTQQYISLTELRKIPVIYPNKEIIELYLETCKVNFDMIYNLTKENQKLTQLRDTLLPKLLSGEIEIPDELEV
ncbi:restriction endonuclease subunit S [Peribacillus sp. S4]|uniref:restriction endonuclease subunit S n=1 Tax=Peribacillus sp. S4 TaxID=3384451 RepID=UPI003989DAA3